MTWRDAIYLRCDAPGCRELSPFDANPIGAHVRVETAASAAGWFLEHPLDHHPAKHYCPEHASMGRSGAYYDRRKVQGRKARGKGCNDATSVDGVAVDYGRSGSNMRRSRRQ